jgi:hypothetical protein
VTKLTRFTKLTFALSLALIGYESSADAKPYQGTIATPFMRKDNNSFHHFTIYDSEIQQIKASNKWTLLQPDFYAFDHKISGLVPLYRLQKNGDHFFTIDQQERLNAINTYGYSDEQICCYISAGPVPGTVPLLRFRKGGIHFYQALLSAGGISTSYDGWTLEGVAGYVWPARDSSGAASLPPVLQEP